MQPYAERVGPRAENRISSVTSQTCAAIAAALGIVALLGWVVGLPLLSNFGERWIPMAPSTALLLVLFGAAVLVSTSRARSSTAYLTTAAIGGAGASIALLLLSLSSQGIHLEAEHLGIAISGAVGQAPIGHMSPVVALCFILAGVSLVATPTAGLDRPAQAMTAFWLASLMVFASTVFLLAYVFGTPLLYGGKFIPPALTTSIALAALGVALVAHAAPRAWAPNERVDAQTLRASFAFVLVFVLMTIGLVTAGGVYYRSQATQHRAEIERQLSAIADLKVSELVNWRAERFGDAALLNGNIFFADLVRRALGSSPDAQARYHLINWLRQIRDAYGYASVSMVDAQGVAQISIPDIPLSADELDRARQALRSGAVSLHDFHRTEPAAAPHLSLLVPIVAAADGSRPLGLVMLDIDPGKYLYPLIERWPTASRTAETLLVRRDNNDVLYLSETRFRKHAALALRFPLTRTELPAVKAVLGQEGIVEGADYRGAPVIAAVRAVPGTPWFLVARMDTEEFLASIEESLWLTAALVGALLLSAGAALGLIWRHQRVRHYKDRSRAAEALVAGTARYQAVTQTATDAIITADRSGIIVGWNAGAERIFGHSEPEALGQSLTRLMPQRYREGHLAGFGRVQDGAPLGVGRGILEMHGLTKAGSEFPIELSLSEWKTSEDRFFTAIIRDISERKRAATALARQKDLYDMLSQTNQAIVRMTERGELFPAVCRIAVQFGRFRYAWIGIIDKKDQQIKPVAHYGEDAGYVEQMRISVDASDPAGSDQAGQAYRTGHHVVSNDISNDSAHAKQDNAARHAGVLSSAAFPIRERDCVVGVMVLAAGEPGYFADDLLPTLDEMATDVSFALDNFERQAELVRAMQALRESESSYRSLFENMLNGYAHCHMVFDDAGRPVDFVYLDVNKSFERLTGLKNVVGKPVSEVIPGIREVSPELFEAYGRVASSGNPETFEFDFKSQSQWYTVSVYSPVQGNFVAVFDDITERKRAERALGESEARYRSLFAHSSVTMLLINPATGRIEDANVAASSYYGWDLAALRGMSIFDINISSLDQVQAELNVVWDENKRRFEFRHRLANGEERDVEVFSGPVEIGSRKLILSVVQDITERKMALDGLRAAEEQFRGLVEQTIAGIYIVQDGKFAYVNPRLAEILGYDGADQLIGRDPLSVAAEPDRTNVARNMRLSFEDGAPSANYSFTALRKDGTMIDVGVHGARATHGGRPAVIGLMQDISEKKRAQDQIQHYVAKLEKSFMHTVGVATTLSEMRDPYTTGHERQVAEIAVAIGAELGFDVRRLQGIRVAGYLHDIGKITVPLEILTKPGPLTPIEWQMIQQHSQASYDVLKDVEFPWPVAEIVLQHHERMDGSGYPRGLKGDDILLDARILAVADTVEAMSSPRPYRAGLGIDKAMAEIEKGRGIIYDPMVADACLRLFREKGYTLPKEPQVPPGT